MSSQPSAAETPSPPLAPIDPEQPAFIRVPVKCLDTVITALERAGFVKEAKAVRDFSHTYVDPALDATRKAWIERAIAQVGKEGEIEFDSDSTFSQSNDNGEYMLGWVWVDGPPKDPEED